jgi:hypothetical protein
MRRSTRLSSLAEGLAPGFEEKGPEFSVVFFGQRLRRGEGGEGQTQSVAEGFFG